MSNHTFLKTIGKNIGWMLLFPIQLAKRFGRLLRLSISSKIIFGYLMMYLIVNLLTDCTVIGMFAWNIKEEIEADGRAYINEIQSRIVEGDITKSGINDLLEGTKIYGVILDEKGMMANQTTAEKRAIHLYEVASQRENEYYLIRQCPSLAIMPERYYRQQKIITDENQSHLMIELYHPLFLYLSEIDAFAITGIIIVLGQTAGFFILWLFGAIRTGKMLKPIKMMTQTTKEINGSTLDVRLNVEKAQYELKDLALTINAMMERIEASYGRQRRFVSDVSHELRTPIAIVKGYVDMLDRWGKDDPDITQEAIDALKNEAENMRLLVEKLLFLVRYDNATLIYEKSMVSLEDIIREVLAETRMIDKYHQIDAKIEDNIDLCVDAVRIKQVVRIFVDNAIKYTPPGGSITIRLWQDSTFAYISVKDTGNGISKHDLVSIFDRFYRADVSRTRSTGSHGLGLAIAKAIALGHGGLIKVRSKERIGSEFILVVKK